MLPHGVGAVQHTAAAFTISSRCFPHPQRVTWGFHYLRMHCMYQGDVAAGCWVDRSPAGTQTLAVDWAVERYTLAYECKQAECTVQASGPRSVCHGLTHRGSRRHGVGPSLSRTSPMPYMSLSHQPSSEAASFGMGCCSRCPGSLLGT
jgi:hypothetical protein